MHKGAGATHWFIPDGYIPEKSSGDMVSHESVCVINSGSEDAELVFTIFFEDRDPLENIRETVKGRRTFHIRTSSLQSGGEFIPLGVPYAIEVQSNVPIVVQYSRLDTTQAELALMSVVAYPVQ
ncbi:MAG: hypothetical protein K0Q59_5230 [Paenibacillus sp.]|nr:hypothetical protein [Paenibacillus sp.]